MTSVIAVLVVALLLVAGAGAPAAAAPEGAMTWVVHVSLAPSWAFGVIAGHPFTSPYEDIRLERGRP